MMPTACAIGFFIAALLVALPSNAATAAKTKAVAPKPLPAATEAQVSAAALLHLGRIPCELGAHVQVSLDAKQPGYVNIAFGKQQFKALTTMSRTGALRAEDNSKGVLWLQLGNKSMLMDVKRGQRLADDCVHGEQMKAVDAAKGKPVEGLLDARPAAAAVAAAASSPASSAASSAAGTASSPAPAASR